MKKKFIPVIGTISAGKSTFLQGLLGTSVLQSGSTTTTKFVCLIQNSKQMKFYHVLPKVEKGIKFIKDGEEIVDEEKIKQKIKNINESLSKKSGTKDDIFYILETPIKNFDNAALLEECYFMDIPGLNENKSSYFDIIFSLLTFEDIKFEIMVFDSTCIDSEIIIDIIKKLEKKKCLKKSGNLFILNRIDEVTKVGKEDIINAFKQNFYQNFEDDKKDDLIFINFNENKFVPMNSLLYLADTKYKEDFYSMLEAEFFNFIDDPVNKEQFNSFYNFLQKKMEFSIDNLDSKGKSVNLDIKKITKQEEEIIKKSVEELINSKKKFGSFLNIKLTNKSNKNDIYKIFLLFKNKAFIHNPSTYYIELQKIIKQLGKSKNDLSKPNTSASKSKQKEESNTNNIAALNELENFIKSTFKKIDPNNELDSFQISLQCIREGIIGRKLRIAFIGNISVGKSSVLNSIIGEDLLPTNDKECTYRGIIIRHCPGQEFKLYKTKLETRGTGIDEYYYFIDEKDPYCQTVEKIKSVLNNKNNDKIMNAKDAYLVITGPLKIFDFIKLDKEIVSKIEFIDLPGTDRKNNLFNEQKFYKKILRFSNCCIYINEPKTVDDKNSVLRMTEQYESDKQKIFPIFRRNFIKTCLFLFNKSDEIENEQKKRQLADGIMKHILPIENNIKRNDMNISYFSGKYFLEYLQVINLYINLLEKNPYQFIVNIYANYRQKLFGHFRGFKKHVLDSISKIEENFSLDEIEDVDAPETFITKYRNEFKNYEKICMFKLMRSENDYDEVIERLYNINKKLKSANFSNTYYSNQFLFDLKRAIENSQNLYQENFINSFQYLFENMDILFDKELKKEEEGKKLKKKKELFNLKFIKETIQKNFENTKNNIKKTFTENKKEILDIIDSEIKNKSQRLKVVDNNLDEATKKLQENIKKIIEKLQNQQQQEFGILNKTIEKEIEAKLREIEENKGSSDLNTNKDFTSKTVSSLINTTLTGVAIRTGFSAFQESFTAGVKAGKTAYKDFCGGPIGIVAGITWGLLAGLFTFFENFSKEKRYEKALNDFRIKMDNDLNEAENNCLDDFKTFEDEFNRDFSQKLAAVQKNIVNINEKEWNELKKKYKDEKNSIMKQIGFTIKKK